MSIPQNQRDFVPYIWVPSHRIADALAAVAPLTGAMPDPRVPLQWQGSTGFRVAHYIAAAWVLACVGVSVGVYLFAALAN